MTHDNDINIFSYNYFYYNNFWKIELNLTKIFMTFIRKTIDNIILNFWFNKYWSVLFYLVISTNYMFQNTNLIFCMTWFFGVVISVRYPITCIYYRKISSIFESFQWFSLNLVNYFYLAYLPIIIRLYCVYYIFKMIKRIFSITLYNINRIHRTKGIIYLVFIIITYDNYYKYL